MTVLIHKITFADVEGDAEFAALVHEYALECAIDGLPAPGEKLATYRTLDLSGMFRAFGAFVGGVLIGFVAVLTPVIPHYGVAVGVVDSFFVAAAHRKSGAGLLLLRAAEDAGRDKGVPGLLVSAPTHGRLAQVMPGLGYIETNRVFFKRLDELALPPSTIPAMADSDIDAVQRLEQANLQRPQHKVATSHAFHAGLYARTVTVPAGCLLTGALIKIATVLIANGHALMYLDGAPQELRGYNVLLADARRKQAFVALADTHLTMLFATDAKTIEDAEREFTDEHALLVSRHADAENRLLQVGS